MNNVLETLLNMEIPQPQTKEYKVKRLSECAGQDVVFSLKELTFSRIAEIKKQHNDDGEMSVHIVLAGTTSPSWKDTGLLKKYKAATPAELIKNMLMAGEIEDLARAVERLSGFRVSTIEEVKKN